MATKAQGCSCYDKAAPNEPIFVLRAQDQYAADVVRYWAFLVAGKRSMIDPPGKVGEALNCAAQMDAWPVKKIPD